MTEYDEHDDAGCTDSGSSSDTREYDERGNPIPQPGDECEACGVRREDRPEGFAPEIVTPFGEVEYLCGRCRDRGRGMK